ncbi:hypothetical protein [Caproicibacterium sp. BJN0003]|uniref:hypothetical protein n=1 Tax=Caproicibacterium sp. BJN0003 TaxID=2994078 RepID=UPI002255FCE0|nr:hypothetical protein [Caproicibacterium sp. BJN0003]UZT82297.1 hypothetical protein OP489_00375 [Caproicibacterium sp. BJN0003]
MKKQAEIGAFAFGTFMMSPFSAAAAALEAPKDSSRDLLLNTFGILGWILLLVILVGTMIVAVKNPLSRQGFVARRRYHRPQRKIRKK